MTHLDENIIELYLLGKEQTGGITKHDVEEHLEKCSGCKELYDEMKEFYNKVEEVNSKTEVQQITDGSLNIVPTYTTTEPIEKETGLVRKFTSIVKKHPIKSSIGMLAAGFAFSFMMFKGTAKAEPVYEPELFIANDSTSTLEIYNSDSKLIDEFKWAGNRPIQQIEMEYKLTAASILDLNNDGIKEIVSVIPNLQGMFDVKSGIIALSKGEVLFTDKIGRAIEYVGWPAYENDFETRGLIIIDGDDGKEIIVGSRYSGRSPFILARYNSKGEKLGEYWHYGHFYTFCKTDINGDGKSEILCAGINDDYEEAGLVLIDPSKIVGVAQSIITNKFYNVNETNDTTWLDKSDAELIYLHVEKNEYENQISTKTNFSLSQTIQKNGVQVNYSYRSNIGSLQFNFDQQLQITSIIPTDGIKLHFQNLRIEGKINFDLDSNYYNLLKSNIVYHINKLDD